MYSDSRKLGLLECVVNKWNILGLQKRQTPERPVNIRISEAEYLLAVNLRKVRPLIMDEGHDEATRTSRIQFYRKVTLLFSVFRNKRSAVVYS